MRATVMIPVYNGEKFLEETIESALDQSYRGDYEVLIVNDGSSDDSGDIADDFSNRYRERVRVIHQPNMGIGATRNVLLDNSRGEFLLGLDSDDRLRQTALEKVVDCFDTKENVGFVYTDQNEISETGELIGVRRRAECHKFFDDIIYFSHFPGHLRAFRKSHINGFHFDSGLKTAEDWDFLLKIVPYVEKEHIPAAVYDYRINNQGISLTKGDLTVEVSAELVKKYSEERKLYGDKSVEVKCTDAGVGIIYYEHEIDGELTMDPGARAALRSYIGQSL